MKKFTVLVFVCVLALSLSTCSIFNKMNRPSPPDEEISEIIKKEHDKMLNEAKKNEIKAEKEKELAAKIAREEFIANRDSIEELLINAGYNKMPAEKIFQNGEEVYIKNLGADKRKNVYAIRLILPAEPTEIQSKWWTSAVKNSPEFEDGLYFLAGWKLNEKAFSYIFLIDLEKIEFDQFVVVLRYTHPLSGIKYNHQVTIDKTTLGTENTAKK